MFQTKGLTLVVEAVREIAAGLAADHDPAAVILVNAEAVMIRIVVERRGRVTLYLLFISSEYVALIS